jgi:hypothetical protein
VGRAAGPRRRHAPARAADSRGKRKGPGGEEEEKEERGGCTAAPPEPHVAAQPALLRRRTPTSPSGLQGGRLRKQHRAWLLREGAVPGVVALRPLLSCCAPRRRPCLLPLHRARRNAQERGCSTGVMSPRKPWTAPPCFLCSRPFLYSTAPLRRRVQEREVRNPPRPCCGPGLRAEAGPSLVSSLFVCCLLSRIAPPRRPAVA